MAQQVVTLEKLAEAQEAADAAVEAVEAAAPACWGLQAPEFSGRHVYPRIVQRWRGDVLALS